MGASPTPRPVSSEPPELRAPPTQRGVLPPAGRCPTRLLSGRSVQICVRSWFYPYAEKRVFTPTSKSRSPAPGVPSGPPRPSHVCDFLLRLERPGCHRPACIDLPTRSPSSRRPPHLAWVPTHLAEPPEPQPCPSPRSAGSNAPLQATAMHPHLPCLAPSNGFGTGLLSPNTVKF